MSKRVYFAFHYQDVIDFRANVVRNHNMIEGSSKAGYFDASIWEDAKKEGDIALKRMINSELKNTSITIVLIGSETYSRRWVQYEIMKSIERGNSLLGIHINSISGKDGKTKALGKNPFDHLGLEISTDGKSAKPIVWNGTSWVRYTDLASFSINELPETEKGKSFKLSHWLPIKNWIKDDGYKNFEGWIS